MNKSIIQKSKYFYVAGLAIYVALIILLQIIYQRTYYDVAFVGYINAVSKILIVTGLYYHIYHKKEDNKRLLVKLGFILGVIYLVVTFRMDFMNYYDPYSNSLDAESIYRLFRLIVSTVLKIWLFAVIIFNDDEKKPVVRVAIILLLIYIIYGMMSNVSTSLEWISYSIGAEYALEDLPLVSGIIMLMGSTAYMLLVDSVALTFLNKKGGIILLLVALILNILVIISEILTSGGLSVLIFSRILYLGVCVLVTTAIVLYFKANGTNS